MTWPPCPAPPPGATWIYLVRHGATENNEAHPPRIQGRKSDPPLSATGQAQAAALGRLLASAPLAAVYSSPLLRARQTAAPLAAALGLSVNEVPELTECDVGQWEGRTWEDVAAGDGDAYRRFREDPAVHPYRGGENLAQVLDRVAPAMRELIGRHPGQSLAVVAHNIVNRVWLAELLDVPLSRCRDVLVQHNGGVSVIEARPARAKVLVLNASFHLDHWQ